MMKKKESAIVVSSSTWSSICSTFSPNLCCVALLGAPPRVGPCLREQKQRETGRTRHDVSESNSMIVKGTATLMVWKTSLKLNSGSFTKRHSGLAASKLSPLTTSMPKADLDDSGHERRSLPTIATVCRCEMMIDAVETHCVTVSGCLSVNHAYEPTMMTNGF